MARVRQLRELLDPCCALPDELLKRSRACASSTAGATDVATEVLRCAGCSAFPDGFGRQAVPLMAPPSSSMPRPAFTTQESMMLVVRILGSEQGDLVGDQADPLGWLFSPAAGLDAGPPSTLTGVYSGSSSGRLANYGKLTLTMSTSVAVPATGASPPGSAPKEATVAEVLRDQASMATTVGVLQQHLPQFEQHQEPQLLLTTLTALLLQLLPAAADAVAAASTGAVRGPDDKAWWIQEDSEAQTGPPRLLHSVRRQLVSTVLQVLRCVNDDLCCRPKVTALRCLQCLVLASRDCSEVAALSGCSELVASILRRQLRTGLPSQRLPGAEEAIAAECRCLASMARGSRRSSRRLGDIGLEADAAEVMEKFLQNREVATTGLLLLSALTYDVASAAKVCSTGLDPKTPLAALYAVMKRWPLPTKEVLKWQPLPPAVKELLDKAR